MNNKPHFKEALERLLQSISNRDFDTYKSFITEEKEMYTIVQNGHAFTSSEELLSIHEKWFEDPSWIWEGEIIRTVVGEDMALAIVKYNYRTKKEAEPVSSWLTYVFKLENNKWRVIHDQSTTLDFVAFAKMAGINI